LVPVDSSYTTSYRLTIVTFASEPSHRLATIQTTNATLHGEEKVKQRGQENE